MRRVAPTAPLRRVPQPGAACVPEVPPVSAYPFIYSPAARLSEHACLVCARSPIAPVSTVTIDRLPYCLCSNECAKRCAGNMIAKSRPVSP